MGTINARIKAVRHELKLSQATLAKAIGVGQTTVGWAETDGNNVPARTILAICRAFNIREEWLRTGDGEMFDRSESDSLELLQKEYSLTGEDVALIREIVSLPPETRSTIITALVWMADRIREESSIDAQVEEYRRQLLLEKRESQASYSGSANTA